MKNYLKNKYLGLMLLVMVLAGAAFVVQAQTAQDNFDFGYFQCSRHGFGESSNCNGVWDYYGARNDYVGGSVSFNWAGHRHGSSSINSQVCLYSNFSFQCQTFACAGASCGFEYGGEHPWNDYGGGNISFSSAPSHYRVFRSASVTDAEVRVSTNGYALYEVPTYGCTDSTASNYNNAATVDDGSCTYTYSMVNLNFVVKNQSGVAISGASVNINQNFGNGTNRSTDGAGFASFGVHANTVIGYSVLSTGCTSVNSSVNSGNNGTTVEVTMNCGGASVGDRPTCLPGNQHALVGQTVNFTANSNGGGPVTWSAPGGVPSTGSGLSFSTSYATAGVKTATASNNLGSTYFSSCTVDVQQPGPIVPGVVSVDRPACSNVPYNATINWPGFAPAMVEGVPTYFADVTTDPTWNTFWNKRITNGAVSTIALDTFSCLPGNSCFTPPVGETMILQPNKTYYARIWNGSHQPSSSGISFNVPNCDPAPVLAAPVMPAVCIPPTETYQLNLNWSGDPHPTAGYYVDVTTDPSFGSFWNKQVSGITNSTTALSGFSCSPANWCFSAPPGPMTLQPGVTYYTRVYGAGGHSNTREFTLPQCRLITASYNGNGTVTGPVGVSVTTGFPFPVVTLADGINCGPGQTNCSEWYPDGTQINAINATPAAGNQFGSWSLGANMVCPGSTVSSCVFNITSNRTADANFSALAGFNYSLSAPATASVVKGTGNASGSHPVTRNLTSGISQPVILSLSGAVLSPGVVEYSISNNHSSCVTAGCAGFSSPSSITFTVFPGAPVGNHTITVTGNTTSGPAVTRTTTFTLNIQAPTISASCSSNPTPATQASLGQQVTWTAVATGANAPFTYTWSGTGIPTAPPPSSNPYTIAYSTIGNKTAAVTVVDSLGYVIGPVTCNNGVPLRVRFSPTFNEF